MSIQLPEALRPVWDALERHGEYELARVMEQEFKRCAAENERYRGALEEIAEHADRYAYRTQHLQAIALAARAALGRNPTWIVSREVAG